jgi:predicted NAD-dependent protein-ADP-ribosyltransferase YbiA (DUF1768 family)
VCGVSKVKDDFMYECVKAKFTQHDDIRRTLLDTADALIVEHTAHGNTQSLAACIGFAM